MRIATKFVYTDYMLQKYNFMALAMETLLSIWLSFVRQ